MTATTSALAISAPYRALVHSLEVVGWSLISVEIDLHAATARIELRQGDLLITFDARNGRASTTRERVRTCIELRGRRGDRFRAEVLRTEFVGRTRHEGIRSGLRSLCNYLEDNAAVPAARASLRPSFAALLS